MSIIEEAEKLLACMSRDEKAQLLQKVTQDLADTFPGIDSTPDVCGGESRVVRTRIPIWVLEQARRQGANDADLLHAYPTLRPEDLTNAWRYVDTHKNEIEMQIRDHEAA